MPRNDSSTSAPSQINLIAAGTTLEGTITTKDDIRISGRLKGTLNVEGKAIIAQEGQVEGDVHSTDADIAGTLKGQVHVKGRLVLKSSAKIEGTIQTTRLIVEEGATIDGECRMGTLDKQRADALKAAPKTPAPKPHQAAAQPKPAKQSSFSLLSGE